MTLALAGVSLIASLGAWLRLHTIHGTLFGGLLFDPGMRFSDLRDVINAAASNVPYGTSTPSGTTYGPSYPPGAFAIGDAFSGIPIEAPRILLVTLTAAAVGMLFGGVMLRTDTRFRQRLAFGVGATSTLVGSALLDYYTALLAIACTLVLITLIVGWRNWTLTASVALPIMGGLSFPIVFAIDRLNVDLVVFQLVTLTVFLMERNRGKLAAGAFGIAVAVKAYPIYFAVADPRRHGRWTRAAIAFGTAIALTAVAVSNMNYSPHDLVDAFRRSSSYFQEHYIIASEGMPYGASLFTAASIIRFKLGHLDVMAFNTHLYAVWKPGAAIATVLLAAIVVILRFPAWCRLMVVVAALIILSPNTGAYRETMLLIPLGMWIARSASNPGTDRYRRITDVLLGLALGVALSPLTFFQIPWFEPTLNLTSQSLLGPLAITLVLGLSLMRGIQDRNRPLY